MDPSFFFSGWEPLLRILVVVPLAYASLIMLLRVSGKRTLARMNAFDFIVTIALGATFGRVVTATSVSLSEAVTGFLVLVVLQYVVAAAQQRFTRFARLVTAEPTLLWYRGRLLTSALQAERITETELLGVVRRKGLGSLMEAEAVVLETDGRFAVVKRASIGDGSAVQRLADHAGSHGSDVDPGDREGEE